MIYEVITRIKPQFVDDAKGFHLDLPMQIKITPETVNVKNLFSAILTCAYEMAGGEKPLTTQDIHSHFRYAAKQPLYQRLRGMPDERTPSVLSVDKINDIPLHLLVSESYRSPGTYDMSVLLFERKVGSIDTLFEKTKAKL